MNKNTSMDRGCLAGILICVLGIFLALFLAASAVAKPKPTGWVSDGKPSILSTPDRICDEGMVALKFTFSRWVPSGEFGYYIEMEVVLVTSLSHAVRALDSGELPSYEGVAHVRLGQKGRPLLDPQAQTVRKLWLSEIRRAIYGE